MKEITLNSWITFAFCAGILIMLFFIFAYYIVEWGKRNLANENEYDDLYESLSVKIDKFPVNPQNYNILLNQLMRLGQLKFKNREKTEVLTVTFFSKFKSEAKKRVENNA